MGLSKLWRPCEKIISKALSFSSAISGILEKEVRVERKLRLYSGFSDGWSYAEDHLDGVLFDHLMLEGEQRHTFLTMLI